MSRPSGPLAAASRQQMRAYLGQTLAGKRHGWNHLTIKHNSLEYTTPCRFCDGPAKPAEGPAIFWDTDALCSNVRRRNRARALRPISGPCML